MPEQILLGIILYFAGVVATSAKLWAEPRFRKRSDIDLALSAYVWPLIFALGTGYLLVALPYRLGKWVGECIAHDSPKPWCCKPGCHNPVEFRIHEDRDDLHPADNFTESCEEHVGWSLGTVREQGSPWRWIAKVISNDD